VCLFIFLISSKKIIQLHTKLHSNHLCNEATANI
jgi:hypothetical protein